MTEENWLQRMTDGGHAKLIGAGAYGEVFLVRPPNGEEPVVAKVNSHARVMRREASFLAHLDGRGGAPRLINVSPERDDLIVMEYCEGDTLMRLLLQKSFRDTEWLQMLRAIAERLDELHQAGIVHTDFKMDNCIIATKVGEDDDNQRAFDARIIDFGIST